MSVIHREKASEKLSTVSVWITDTAPNSTYFRISQMPDILTAGKNSFLINGSPQLVNTTAVKVEIIDVNGNVIFSQPIKNYSEGASRLVSIEVYEDTPMGMATMTILGHLAQDVDGNLPPAKFVDAYNVKWQQKILVSPNRDNTSRIILQATPEINVSEILNPFRAGTDSIIIASSSNGEVVQGMSSLTLINEDNSRPNAYIVLSSLTPFIKQMEQGQIFFSYSGSSYTSSISRVINNAMLQIDPAPTASGLFVNFSSSISYSIQYTGSATFLVTQNTRSFADVIINRLSTLSGNIYKTKVFVTSIETPGNPELVAETVLQPAEMMQTSSYISGKQKVRTGYFTDQSVPENYWVIGTMDLISLYNPS